jgi:alginate O-acetyltransferase complex protein AlgI
MMGWVLFRADTFSGAGHFFAALAGMSHVAQALPLQRYAGNEVVCALILGALFSMPLWDGIKSAGTRLAQFLPARSHGVYFGLGQAVELLLTVAVLLVSAAWLAGGTYNPFIYFRF